MDQPSASSPETEEDITLSLEITRRTFRPLAALAIGKVPYDRAASMLRDAYVRAATEELRRKQPDKPLTHSAIALLTGLDGRTIRDIINDEETGDAQTDELVEMSPNAQVLGSWASHERWQDPETGKPLKLKIYGAGKTFQALVKSTIGKSVSYAMVLETLLEHGNIRRVEDNRVELVNRLFKSNTDLSQKRQANRLLHGMGRNIINRIYPDPGEGEWPRGIVWNQRVRPERLEQLRCDMVELITQHIAYEIGETLDAHADQEDRQDQVTASFGCFYWEDPREPMAGDNAPEDKKPDGGG